MYPQVSIRKRQTSKWPFTGGLNLTARERHPLWDLGHVWSAEHIGLRFCCIWGREFCFGSQNLWTVWTAVPQTLVTPASDLTLGSLEAWWRIFFPWNALHSWFFLHFFLLLWNLIVFSSPLGLTKSSSCILIWLESLSAYFWTPNRDRAWEPLWLNEVNQAQETAWEALSTMQKGDCPW